MNEIQSALDGVVQMGIRAYIDLIGRGEQVRSVRIFKEVLGLSALFSGGPSCRIASEIPSRDSKAVLMRASVRSLLATLLVLRFSHYWQAAPALDCLADNCDHLARLLDQDGVPAHASGGTSCEMNERNCTCAGDACGCRRSNALPAFPTLSQ